MEGRIIHMEEYLDNNKFSVFYQITVRVEQPPDVKLGYCEIHNIDKPSGGEQDDKAYYC